MLIITVNMFGSGFVHSMVSIQEYISDNNRHTHMHTQDVDACMQIS